MIKFGEEVADVRVQHPVHSPIRDPDRQRVQRVMWLAPRPEPVGEAPEVHLVDRVQHLDDGPLNDLVLQRGDTQRTLPPVGLRDVDPPARLGPIPALLHPSMQLPEVGLQVLPVLGPRHPVHPRRRLTTDRRVGLAETGQVNVVQQRGEPRILVLCRYFPHTLQRIGRPLPGPVSGGSFAGRVPLGRPPSLHHLRSPGRSRSLVRRLHRYYAVVRLPALVHPRRTAIGVPWTAHPAIDRVGERRDLPVLVHGGSVHAMVLRPRGVRQQLAVTLPPVWPSATTTASAPRTP